MSLVCDLDTIAMFYSSGALHSEEKLGTFAEHRVNILETTKVLVDNTKKLVSSTAGTQEQLAEAAIQAVKTITAEAEHVKLGASSLATEDMEGQVGINWETLWREMWELVGNIVDALMGIN